MDTKQMLVSKTVIGVSGIVGCIVANALGYMDGATFQIGLGVSVGLAGYGARQAMAKVFVPLEQILKALPDVEKAVGLPGTDVSNVKITKSVFTSQTTLGIVGAVGAIAANYMGVIDDKSYEMALALSGGVIGIGGRAAIQKILLVLGKVLAVLPLVIDLLQAADSTKTQELPPATSSDQASEAKNELQP